jgi:hypothetical protein
MKNILCFEGEWKFNTHKKPERFDLNSEPILRMLKEYHKCDAIYRHILTKEDLKIYIEYFNRHCLYSLSWLVSFYKFRGREWKC